MEHTFSAIIERSGDMDATYVVVPVNIREVYGKGRIKVDNLSSINIRTTVRPLKCQELPCWISPV